MLLCVISFAEPRRSARTVRWWNARGKRGCHRTWKCFRATLAALLLLSICAVGWADQVTPSDRVTTRLRIRATAASNSAIVGWLSPGDSRQLLGSEGASYKIELPNGQSGFVAKSWARVIPDGAPAPAAAAAILRLGSWNLRKLGHGDNKNYAAIAQAIKANFDLLAVVEVMQKSGGHPGYDALIAQLGQGWNGLVTEAPRPKTNSGSSEFYAIVFRPDRVHTCSGWASLRIVVDNDGGSAGTGDDVFAREPAFGCFIATQSDGTPGFDFLLAAYHADWAEGDIGDIQNEVKHVPEVFAAMSAARSGERDVFMVGDFNLRPVDLAEVLSANLHDATTATGSTLNSQGAVTDNLYDHLLYSGASAPSELQGNASVLDLRSIAADNKKFFQTVSDHLPIVVQFRIGPDNDP